MQPSLNETYHYKVISDYVKSASTFTYWYICPDENCRVGPITPGAGALRRCGRRNQKALTPNDTSNKKDLRGRADETGVRSLTTAVQRSKMEMTH